MIVKHDDFVKNMSGLECCQKSIEDLACALSFIERLFEIEQNNSFFIPGIRYLIKILGEDANATSQIMRGRLDNFYGDTLVSRQERLFGHDPDEHLFDPDNQPAMGKGKVKP